MPHAVAARTLFSSRRSRIWFSARAATSIANSRSRLGRSSRTSALRHGQVDDCCVDGHKLQEWREFLRDSPRSGNHSKVGLVHASPHPACNARKAHGTAWRQRHYEVEVDETFIGGASRFMHKERRIRAITDKKMKGKIAVMGMLGARRQGSRRCRGQPPSPRAHQQRCGARQSRQRDLLRQLRVL